MRLDDRCECQIAERAVSVPALVAGLADQALRPRTRIQLERPRRQPLDPREAVALLAAPLRVAEMIGERARVGLGEPEAGQRRHNVSFTHFHGILTNAGDLFRRGRVLVLVQRGSRSEAPGSAGSGGRPKRRLSPLRDLLESPKRVRWTATPAKPARPLNGVASDAS